MINKVIDKFMLRKRFKSRLLCHQFKLSFSKFCCRKMNNEQLKKQLTALAEINKKIDIVKLVDNIE